MTELDALLAGIVADPREETRWLVLADWLEEHDDPRRAELLRLHRKMLATCCEPDAHPQRAEWQGRMVELLVGGVRPCVPQETLALPGGVPLTFAFIPPGAFLMGSEKGGDDEKPVRRVEVEQGFFMGIYPVTQEQWFAVMGTESSFFKGPDRPVVNISWPDAQEFSIKLTELTDRRIKLPNEAEWESACRAGTTTEYHFGDAINTDIANYHGRDDSPKGEYRAQTTNVGSFPANMWGLFDVHGNVWEWCASSPRARDAGAPTEVVDRGREPACVLRGGCWSYSSYLCRSAIRIRRAPEERNFSYGFRVCLRLD